MSSLSYFSDYSISLKSPPLPSSLPNSPRTISSSHTSRNSFQSTTNNDSFSTQSQITPTPFELVLAASLTTLFSTLFFISSFLSIYLFLNSKKSTVTDQCTIVLFFFSILSLGALLAILKNIENLNSSTSNELEKKEEMRMRIV